MMRLIHTPTMKLTDFIGRIPRYAILSHTWSTDDNNPEISLQDMKGNDPWLPSRQAFRKIEATCRQAQRDGIEYAWVDSCCIDKTSSAELGEAINSMYRWYQQSHVCYAYLEDVFDTRIHDVRASGSASSAAFARSGWFGRGWTLQELIAPSKVVFYNAAWRKLAEKRDIVEQLEGITGIDEFVLRGGSPQRVSVGRRMSWAAGRKTTRPEDIAYSLLGIFDVNMPLLYGEGLNAFTRLQEQILQQSDDHTLFAWRASKESAEKEPLRGLLARSPDEFANFRDWSYHSFHGETSPRSDNILQVWPRSPVGVSKRGIHFVSRTKQIDPRGFLDQVFFRGHASSVVLPLNCSVGGDPQRVVGLYLQLQDGNRYARSQPSELTGLPIPKGRSLPLCGIRTTSELKIGYYDNPWGAKPPPRQQKEKSDEDEDTDADLDTLHIGATALTPRRSTTVEGYYLCGIFTADEDRGPLRCYSYQHEFREGRALTSALFLQLRRHRRWTLLLKGRSESDIVLVTFWVDGRDLRFNAERISVAELEEDPEAITRAIQGVKPPEIPVREKFIPMPEGAIELKLSLRDAEIQGQRTWDLDMELVDRGFWLRILIAGETTVFGVCFTLASVPHFV
ncbi:Vegetative incompatibility protein HET-E-1-like protein 13 [Colletotrichum plurivorum]|uniref:Vegetative incompatibility protein HET-E-1-like protein 13 n=1 Tax=Colletotrichum plurivorum TaxID=2175906 RepID=A0A8H6N2G3_9PEZI|nr:Vegetative incompatibility protein HET-E-1-like protein 13 [Colletotrichum plurivorum]